MKGVTKEISGKGRVVIVERLLVLPFPLSLSAVFVLLSEEQKLANKHLKEMKEKISRQHRSRTSI